ncbi:hypothetical protein GCM10023084_60410 [Streptomyces lacrimifluminis]
MACVSVLAGAPFSDEPAAPIPYWEQYRAREAPRTRAGSDGGAHARGGVPDRMAVLGCRMRGLTARQYGGTKGSPPPGCRPAAPTDGAIPEGADSAGHPSRRRSQGR